jgi:hypothetical protein
LCSLENLPVFLPETLPEPSANLPGCSIIYMHYFFRRKQTQQILTTTSNIYTVSGFPIKPYIYIYIYSW